MKTALIEEDSRQFAAFLHAARTLWRRHRELVEAVVFPVEYARALEPDVAAEASDCSEYHCPCGTETLQQ